ncbi:MAG: tRNA uridine-5-carboxymethylaminomethyl(34) synthesis enzyme MnmG, partial [Rectinema sp.]|nr:tRNA uridine-5-carboxymethylaminomethyl(34) synthesis enzyme MnmG [Rectinema sp.]
ALRLMTALLPKSVRLQTCSVLNAVLDERYKGYLEKEDRLAARLAHAEKMAIPVDFNYASVRGLSKEAIEKLVSVRPLTIGQASRVPGVRKSDIALLYIAVKKK